MKNLKKVLSLILVVTLMMGLAGCIGSKKTNPGNSQELDWSVLDDNNLPLMNTTDDITLTYVHFDSPVLIQEMAKAFETKYPNINVELVEVTSADANTTLQTMIANGQVPDCFMFTDCDFALQNDLLYDMTRLWESDTETENLVTTMKEAKIGYYGTDMKWATPMKWFPGIIYIDRAVMEKLNIDMPSVNWTWSEMIQIIKDATRKVDDKQYYGLAAFNRLDSYYGIAASQDIIGEFGFDGTKFDLSHWAVGEQEFADLKLGGYVAPDRQTIAMEKWLGDFDAWAGASGQVAIMTEAYWTYLNLWGDPEYSEPLGLDWVPYPIPAVEEVDGVAHSISTMDMGGICASTKHPREAYELLKFMGWGIEGWETRLALYNDETLVTAAGAALIRDFVPAPLTLDEKIWTEYKKLYYNGVDDEYWDAYFSECIEPIPYGWMSIPGYWNYCVDYFNTIGIHTLVDTGQAKAQEYVKDATDKANEFYAQAMKDYFNIDINN
ncbi:MAG: carbohydrate ABC transporter substrate-binding protein [Lachnospiraceae bacterium]|nr:carbohydrate ABC transporter substrate-binding protein [Lachnospiraceae bacterium]